MSALVMLALLCAGGTESDNYNWYEGSIVMTNGEIVVNELAIVHTHEALLIRKKRGRNVIPAHKIVSFKYYDPAKKAFRNYRVIAGKDRGFRCHKFYEIIHDGEVQVLRRIQQNTTHINNVRYGIGHIWGGKELDEELLNYDYYAYINNEVIPVNKFKKKILPRLMVEHETSIKNLIKERRLNLESLGHRVVVIMYYNKLTEEPHNLSLRNDE